MSNRRRLARERLEIYLVHLLLAYRVMLLAGGLVLLVLAVAVMMVHPAAGYPFLLPAVYLLLMSGSYRIVLYTARAGAWICTLGRHDA